MKEDKVKYTTRKDAVDAARAIAVRENVSFRVYQNEGENTFSITTTRKNSKMFELKDPKHKFQVNNFKPIREKKINKGTMVKEKPVILSTYKLMNKDLANEIKAKIREEYKKSEQYGIPQKEDQEG